MKVSNIPEFTRQVRSAIGNSLSSLGISIHRVGLENKKFVHAEVDPEDNEIFTIGVAREYDQGGWEIHGDASFVSQEALASLGMMEIEPERYYAPAHRGLYFSSIATVILTDRPL